MAKKAGSKEENKTKVIGYTRVSTLDQNGQNQRDAINDYAQRNGILVDEFIMVEMSSRKSLQARRIEELKSKLKPGDVLIATEMSRIGRSALEVLGIIKNFLIPEQINFIFMKEHIHVKFGKVDPMTNLQMTMLLAFYEFERDIISLRTKEALGFIKASGKKLGKPRGLVQQSKLDPHVDKIKELLKARVSRSAIARVLGSSRTNLGKYLKKHPEILREVKMTMADKQKG